MGLPLADRRIDTPAVRTYPDRQALGTAAAAECAAALREAAEARGRARVIFASAPSQEELLGALAADPVVPWERVEAFHMDEYVGIGADHPASFRRFLRDRLPIPPASFHGIRGEAEDVEAERHRYADLLAAAGIDVCCLGIGENGHLAFNEPSTADFSDAELVREVELEHTSRQQQVHDRCFPSLASVPRRALTLTIPALLAARRLICVVPGPRKAAAVRETLEGPITPACPASVLRTHPATSLYLDRDSAALLRDED